MQPHLDNNIYYEKVFGRAHSSITEHSKEQVKCYTEEYTHIADDTMGNAGGPALGRVGNNNQLMIVITWHHYLCDQTIICGQTLPHLQVSRVLVPTH